MSDFVTSDDGFFGPMDDINQKPSKSTVIKKTKKGDGAKRRKQLAEKNQWKRLTDDINQSMRQALKRQSSDEYTRLFKSIKKHNEEVSKTPSPPSPKLEDLSKPLYDSDDDLFTGKQSVQSFDPMDVRMMALAKQDMTKPAEFKHHVLKKQKGGSKTRKKHRLFRNNLRKNKISRKYIMLKQCGGGKAKMGSKSKPYSSKRKAMRSRRRVCYYKKKGRTLKMKKKKKGKSRKKSRRRRRR